MKKLVFLACVAALGLAEQNSFCCAVAIGGTERQIVFPKLIEGRSDGELAVVLHEGATLNLRKASVFSDDFDFATHEGGREVVYKMRGEEIEKNLYTDTENHAAVILRSDNGVLLEGIVGENLRIRPLEERGAMNDAPVPHELFEIPKRLPALDEPVQVMFDDVIPPLDISARTSSRNNLRSRGTFKFKVKVTPELRILVDTEHSKHFDSDEDLMEYFAIYAAFANLKFLTLGGLLDLQILVIGIKKLTTAEETFIGKIPGHPNLMHSSTLWRMADYIEENNISYYSDDLVLMVTGRDIAYTDDAGTPYAGTLGIAYGAKACTWEKVALAEDLAKSFSGLLTFVHELGHVLGASHDGNDGFNIAPRDPGATKCPPSGNYIMSPQTNSDNNHRFSSCSSEQILALAMSRSGSCLLGSQRRHSHRVNMKRLQKVQITKDDYCQLKHPESNGAAYSPSLEDNTPPTGIKQCKVVCFQPENGYALTIYAAPDGIPCDDDDESKVCINSKCTTLPRETYTFREG